MKVQYRSVFSRFTLIALLVLLISGGIHVVPALAASIIVNSSADTAVNSDGNCTLREAIIAANTDLPSGAVPGECAAGSSGTDSISFADSYTVTAGSQLPEITTAITITGMGSANTVIQAAASPATADWRIFQVTATGDLTLDKVTVRNGRCTGSCTAVDDEYPDFGGGVYNAGTLTVTDSLISDSEAAGGGGIYNAGTLTVTNSILSGNEAAAGRGGGIYSTGELTLTNSLLSGNTADTEAGIYSTGTLSVTNSTFSENHAFSGSGGIGNNGTGTVSNSTFSGNWAGDGGGGGIENGGTLTVTNSSFSGNHAWVGGGINNFKTLTVTNSTLSNNTVADGNEGGGISSDNSVNASTILENTIVANNGGGNCRGTITNGGSNLDSGTTCGWGSNNGSLSDTDPELGLLAQNGGPTQTMALLAGSPAIDTGNDATCPATDQRGVTRPQGSHCDIGAYESQIEQVPLPSGWLGGVSVTSNKNVVAVGRPHIGNEVASYDGFLSGSTSAYVPMLFKKAFGSYNSALYVQNLHASSTAGITIKYYGAQGNLDCTKTDTIAPLSSKGYWTPAATCDTGSLQDGWTGSVVVTSDQPIVAVARPHIGDEVMTYDGFASGSLTSYIPMLFKGAYGGSYNSAFYIQNVHESNTADITITYYDNTGTLNCTKADTLAPMASKGYWVPSSTCDTGSLPAGWVGGVVVTSDQPIVGVGRPHIGTQITTYNGFPVGGPNAYVPMLFKDAFGGSYDSAFYIQNTDDSNTANITIQYYNNTGTLDCTQTDTLSPLASRGYWLPSATCDTGSLPIGWMGDVIVTSDQPIVSVARPHIGAQVTTYNGFTTGGLSSYLPMLFNKTWGTYNSAFYVQNTENSAATVTLEFYDASGALSCTRTDNIPAFSTLGYWVPGVTCSP